MNEPMNCPACGRKLPMWRRDQRLVPRPEGKVGLDLVTVGKKPAYRPYEPFCTLRCARWYAVELFKRYGHRYKRVPKVIRRTAQ